VRSNTHSTEDIVNLVLENRRLNSVNHIGVDVNLSNQDTLEDEIFDILISRAQFTGLIIHNRDGTWSNIANVLNRAVHNMTNFFRLVLLQGPQMRETTILEIFKELTTSNTVKHLEFFFLSETSEGAVNALAQYIRESSALKCLTLHFGHKDTSGLGLPLFSTICNGIAGSESLVILRLHGRPVIKAEAENASEPIVNAVVKCSSLKSLDLNETAADYPLSLDRVLHDLSRTPSAQSSDLCCRIKVFKRDGIRDGIKYLHLYRACWWKKCLSQDFRLELWPLILAKSQGWKRSSSHQNRDILFFLMREKSDVLLQNVHRRRIRKRKRYGF
jgi:hypothetical protein